MTTPRRPQLLVARPRTFGYLGDPELTATRYFTDEDGTRWWRSADIVRVDDVGIYHHLGRADEMVKVKGAFVAPSRVEAGVAEHRRNRRRRGAAAPRRERLGPRRRPRAGRRRHAHARARRCPAAGTTAARARARHLGASRRAAANAAHETRPPGTRERAARAVAVVAGAQVHDPSSSGGVSPEARRIIGLDDVGPDDDLFEAGLDSIGALELGASLADAGFGEFDPPRLFEARTVAGIERMLGQTRDLDHSTVVVLNDGGSRPPLFALPGGGGTALEYRFLADALGPRSAGCGHRATRHAPSGSAGPHGRRPRHPCVSRRSRLGSARTTPASSSGSRAVGRRPTRPHSGCTRTDGPCISSCSTARRHAGDEASRGRAVSDR